MRLWRRLERACSAAGWAGGELLALFSGGGAHSGDPEPGGELDGEEGNGVGKATEVTPSPR
jgi:hypothetical protein